MKKKQEQIKPDLPEVKRKPTKRLAMLTIAVIIGAIGFICFVIYIFTMNMTVGAPGVFMTAGGILLFYYYWHKSDELVHETLGPVSKEQVNCFNIYPGRVIPENMPKPEGFPQKCRNDGKKYYVNIWNEESKLLKPFILPDQHYYDPIVFAERVLSLPAHRKLFTRRLNTGQLIKYGVLIGVIIIEVILVLITT